MLFHLFGAELAGLPRRHHRSASGSSHLSIHVAGGSRRVTPAVGARRAQRGHPLGGERARRAPPAPPAIFVFILTPPNAASLVQHSTQKTSPTPPPRLWP